MLTHYHSDHIGGLGSVNLQRWVAEGETEPMQVIGPPGLARVIAGFNEAYALDGTYALRLPRPRLLVGARI